MRPEDERRLRGGGNDRVPTIARWLAQKVPKSAAVTELVLTAWLADDEPEALSRWPRADVNEALSVEISALIQDYADDAGQHCRAQLSWVDAEGRPYSSKRFRGLCEKSKIQHVAALDGSMSALLAGNQRHTEALMETTMRERMAADAARERHEARMERLMAMMESMTQRLFERATALEEQAAQLEDTAADAVATAEQAADLADEAQAAASERQDGDRFAQVVELFAKQLTTGGPSA